ncbi:MAG TPA: glycosyltransferase family 4 protein [Candidatus Moranbacteria bacterium]|nr:glycosyltransferase family 4 protein [Candidatus Moranbacteria bacterium]HSA08423.1 glycosyltransferase family 4 protein [Candidatus Moranbacteria bacterium]
MKILFVASLYYPHIGGIETTIRELSRVYIRNGHSVCVLTKKYPAELDEYSSVDGVDIYRIKSAKTREDFVEVAKKLVEIENNIKADCVHVIGLRRPTPLFALLLARKWGVPIVVSAGGGELPEPNDKLSNLIWKESKDIAINVSMQADRNVTFSEDLKKIINKNIDPNLPVYVVYGGVDVNAVSLIKPVIHDRQFIFSCRRLVWSKGIDITINSFARIHNEFPNVDLVIAGDGDEYEDLLELVKKHDVEDRIKFIGAINWEESIAWLKSALFTVVPSRSEGGGLINLESQASGCPVIGSRAAGISEYTSENETSLLFEIENIDECVSRMRELLSNDILRKRLSKNALIYVQKFSWKNIANQYFSIYKDIIQGSNDKKSIILWSEESQLVWDIIKKNNYEKIATTH